MDKCKCGSAALYVGFMRLECSTYGCDNGPAESPSTRILEEVKAQLAELFGTSDFDLVFVYSMSRISFMGEIPALWFESDMIRQCCDTLLEEASSKIRALPCAS